MSGTHWCKVTEWRKTEVLGKQPVMLPLRSTQISDGLGTWQMKGDLMPPLVRVNTMSTDNGCLMNTSYVIHKYTVWTKLVRFSDEHCGNCTGQEAWKIEGFGFCC